MRKLVLHSGQGEVVVPIRNGATAGSLPGLEVHLEGKQVQDRHAVFSVVGQYVFLEDLDTDHGTVVNGKKIRRTKIVKGDTIEIGGNKLVYDEDDQPDPPPAKAKSKAPPAASSTKQAAAAKPASASGKTPAAAKPSGSSAKQPAKPGSALRKQAEGKTEILPKPKSGAQAPSSSSERRPPMPTQSAPRIRVGGMFEGGPNSGGRASSSGIRPASSSGRKGSSGRQAALPGASGKRESVSDRLSSGRSSSMLSSSRLSAAADEAMAATISSRSAPVEAVPFKKMTRIGIVAMLLLIVVPLVVAVGVPQYKRWQKEKQALAERDLALAEALARLKEEQSAKRQDDLALALDRLKTLQNWEDVEKLLGKPSLQFQERIKLWDPVRGTYEQAGQEFRAYYIEDQAKSYQFEDVPLVPVLLFKVEGENKISLLGTHRYARRDTPPLQFHAPKEVQAAPDDAAPPPSDLPPEGQMEVPPNSPDAPPEMPSVSPDAPSPEVPPAPDGEAKTPEAQSP